MNFPTGELIDNPNMDTYRSDCAIDFSDTTGIDLLDLICLRCADDLHRLIAKSVSYSLMRPLHFCIDGGSQFAVAHKRPKVELCTTSAL